MERGEGKRLRYYATWHFSPLHSFPFFLFFNSIKELKVLSSVVKSLYLSRKTYIYYISYDKLVIIRLPAQWFRMDYYCTRNSVTFWWKEDT